ncbi:MAG: transporter substrate-binding domain-containing protein [Chitinispirillales bacterium]|jgi:signal transduction histidine kinase/DNA-binding response OmpR family regulator|nr:transporter substrate-binding domain-containing protein [Chitinispirillales bacterium]
MSATIKQIFAALAALTALAVFPANTEAGRPRDVAAQDLPPFSTYREISGVTDEEAAAIESLRRKYADSALVYGVTESMEAFRGGDGDREVRGFASHVCAYMAKLFGLNIKTAILEWGDLISGLESGKVHFSSDLTPTEKRREMHHHMTGAITNRAVVYFRTEGSEPLAVLLTKRPLRYGFLEGTTTYERVRELSPDVFEAAFVTEYSDARDMLRAGKIDAFFEESPAKAVFDAYGGITSSVFLPMIYEPAALCSQTAELMPVISVMEKFLNNGGRAYFVTLYNRGLRDYNARKLFLLLTDEEKEYIRKHPTVLYAAEYDNYPFSFYNANDKQWQGIAHDILREAAALTGIDFRIANGENTEFSELFKMLEAGKVSFVTELVHTSNRAGRFLWPNTPMLLNRFALVSRLDYHDIGISEVFGVRVGVQSGTVYDELFNRWFPEHPKVAMYGNTNALFGALERGDVDIVMSSQNQVLAVTNYMERPGYKINVLFDYASESAIGFNREERVLCSIIDKAQGLMDLTRITDLWQHKTYDYRVKIMQSRQPLLISISVLLICVVCLMYVLLKRRLDAGRRLEALVEERTEAAEAANRAKSAFLANMSHEIRTPMNSIIGFSELALDCEIPEEPKSYIHRILENSNGLLQIINDILDVSKIEAGKMTIENVPFDMHDVFALCRAATVPKSMEKGLMLHFYAEPIINKRLVGDPTRLRQVFINLISNAVKFTNNGVVKASATVISTAPDTIAIRFEVKDSGIGMTAEEMKRVMEPFTQADHSTTRKYGGTGLGLSIVKNLVELMGGELRVESTPGIGSRFGFDLIFGTIDTVETAKSKSEIADDDLTKPNLDGEILVCEDNRMNQEVIRKHLERVGLRVTIAENGKTGMDIVKDRADGGEKPFDLIFMDINMPVMDGLDAAAQITAIGVKTPIVAMTANVLSSDRELYERSNMYDCIGKPFTSQELWRCLLKHIKPIDKQQDRNNEQAYGDDILLEMRTIFVNDNQNTFAEFMEAIRHCDIQKANRIAHTLKSNAGTIGKPALQAAALDAEKRLANGENTLTPECLKTMETELNAVLAELESLRTEKQ